MLRFGKLAGAALALGLVTLSPALAEDDDELTFEQKIIKNLLGGGDKPNLEYRERSPLVIPPRRDLPSPESAERVEATASWPRDPDAARQKGTKRRAEPAIDAYREQGRNLTPDELRRGAVRGASRVDQPAVTLSDNQMARNLTPAEMGETKNLFGLLGSFVGSDEKPAAFTHEPTRARLTEPPTGYRTPSSSQPYAPPKSTGNSWFKLPDVFDRGLSKDR